MKINLTEELNKLVTDDLIQFAKCGKKLVAKTKKMKVGDKISPIRRNENDKSLLNEEKKPSGIGTILGPSEMVEVPVDQTVGAFEKYGTAAARWRSNLAPGDSTIVPISRVLDQYKIGAKRVNQ